MKNLPPTKSERTRRFIIEKAAPIFNKKGITGTTLSDLTEATGLTKGGIYGNFKDKDAVAVAVFQYHVENLTAFLQREIDQGTTSIEKLLAIPKAYRKLYSTMMAYGGCPILNTAAEADDTHQALCRLTVDAIESMKKIIVSLVGNGQIFGEIRHTTDPETFADILIALIEGGTLLSKATGQDTYMMHCLDHMEGLIHDIRITE
ncbi:MAG: TetR/AcrR family transcriptional regulator [Desulfobacteraceae bacterium]|nr:MAG: TetR/AcrR family transcriptional regulator [Desulfobacteraceae bacterium]